MYGFQDCICSVNFMAELNWNNKLLPASLHNLCLSFPDVTEDIKWGHDLCFMVSGKIFCMTGVDSEFGVSLKVKDEEFEELCTRNGIIPAPYVARYKWVFVSDEKSFTKKEWAFYLRQSYDLVKAKLKKKK